MRLDQGRAHRARWARLAGLLALVIGFSLTAGVAGGWWWTDRQGRITAHRLADAATAQWRSEPPAGPLSAGTGPAGGPAGVAGSPVTGIGGPVVAVVRAPRLGADWRMPVQRGTGPAVLRQGLGMYVGSAAPGTLGNLGLAGHRTTWGAPFRHLDRLRSGDTISVWTARGRFDYRVVDTGVTSPSDVAVVSQAAARGRAMLTLTTCHPEFSARERLFVHAVLARG